MDEIFDNFLCFGNYNKNWITLFYFHRGGSYSAIGPTEVRSTPYIHTALQQNTPVDEIS